MRVLVLVCSLLVSCVAKTPDELNGCAAACSNLRSLGCDGSQGHAGPDQQFGTLDDVSCEDACHDILSARVLPVDPQCLSTAGSCEAADECGG